MGLRRLATYLALALVAALAAAAAAEAAAPQLAVRGNALVDATTGQAFVPHGVNWPSFEYACEYAYGYANSADATTVGPDAAGAAVIASWHVNTVRVPLNQDCWLGDDARPKFGDAAGYRAAVQAWVSTLHAAGLAVILDLHWSGPAGLGADGQRAMADDRSDDFWSSVAATFRDDPAVMFDVFNEPYSRYDGNTLVFDLTWPCWRDGGCLAPWANDMQPVDGNTFTTVGMQALVDVIRAAGAHQPIMLGGRDYANDLAGWLANRPVDGAPGTADDALVASFHNYGGQACATTACWDASIAPVAAEVPVVTGEFGETDCKETHDTTYMTWADAHGVGYLAWAWWVLPDQACGTLALLADVGGTPRAPNGTALKAHLDALAGAPPPGSGGGPPPADAVAPHVTLAGRTAQRLDAGVEVRVRCDEACTVRARGTMVVTHRRKGRLVRASYALTTRTAALPAARQRTLSVGVPRRARRAAAAALTRHWAVRARLTLRVADAAGNVRTRTRVVVLRAA